MFLLKYREYSHKSWIYSILSYPRSNICFFSEQKYKTKMEKYVRFSTIKGKREKTEKRNTKACGKYKQKQRIKFKLGPHPNYIIQYEEIPLRIEWWCHWSDNKYLHTYVNLKNIYLLNLCNVASENNCKYFSIYYHSHFIFLFQFFGYPKFQRWLTIYFQQISYTLANVNANNFTSILYKWMCAFAYLCILI